MIKSYTVCVCCFKDWGVKTCCNCFSPVGQTQKVVLRYVDPPETNVKDKSLDILGVGNWDTPFIVAEETSNGSDSSEENKT